MMHFLCFSVALCANSFAGLLCDPFFSPAARTQADNALAQTRRRIDIGIQF
jgi:hypothetical protein